MKAFAAVLGGGLLVAVAFGSGDELDAVRFRDVEGVCRQALADGRFDGLSLLVVEGAREPLRRAFGYEDAASGRAAEPTASRSVGSLLDLFVCVAALQLAEREELALDAPLAELLPDLEADWPGVTLRHVLEHGSGVPDFTHWARTRRDPVTVEGVLGFLADAPLEFEPGSCFAYSNSDTLLAALAIERASGAPLGTYLEENLFGPAAMTGTSFCAPDAATLDETTVEMELGTSLREHALLPGALSASGLCSNAEDLRRFHAALVDETLVTAESAALLEAELRFDDGTSTGAGYGLEVAELDGFREHSFGGGIGDERVEFVHYPEVDLTIVLLAVGADRPLAPLAHRIARTLLGLPHPEVLDLPLSEEERTVYVGTYYLGCDAYAVRAEGRRLSLATPFADPVELRYQGHHRFFAVDDESVELTFEVEEGRGAVSFVLFWRGFEIRAVRRE